MYTHGVKKLTNNLGHEAYQPVVINPDGSVYAFRCEGIGWATWKHVNVLPWHFKSKDRALRVARRGARKFNRQYS